MTYLPIIGMEIHLELKTSSKMFCGCPAYHFGIAPNTQVCPVCLGLPGALPVPNKQAIYWTMMVGQALECKINLNSKFDRKHYFYPDLPKGYQISQYDEPLCEAGKLTVETNHIRITRVHLEEDTGKLQHSKLDGRAVTLADFNRSGVPLVEIVTEPDLHSAVEAKAYAQEIRRIINFLNVSDCDMEKGSMRLEANISLAPIMHSGSGQEHKRLDSPGVEFSLPPYKVEVKNINSFRFLEKAINFEIDRQTQLLEQGTIPDQETRGFNEKAGVTVSQRSKEGAQDYRYFPEPDIPPLQFTAAEVSQILSQMPKLPSQYLEQFTKTYHLRPESAAVLIQHRRLAEKSLSVFELALKSDLEPQQAANFLINKKDSAANMSPKEIIKHLKAAKMAVPENIDYNQLVSGILTENPDLVDKFRAGKTSVLGALIGAAMKKSQGQAQPAVLSEEFTRKLK